LDAARDARAWPAGRQAGDGRKVGTEEGALQPGPQIAEFLVQTVQPPPSLRRVQVDDVLEQAVQAFDLVGRQCQKMLLG